MTGKQRHGPSIFGSLQMLGRNAFGSDRAHHTWEDNEDNHKSAWNDLPRTSYACSMDVTSSSLRNDSLSSSLLPRGNRAGKSHRHVSMPLPSQRQRHHISKPEVFGHDKKVFAQAEEKNKSQIRRLRLREPRLSTSLEGNEAATKPRPRTAFTRGYATSSSWKSNSRIPTPTKPPDGDIYSHKVYRKEGRRSVLSSLGRRYTSLKKNFERDQGNIAKKKNMDIKGEDSRQPWSQYPDNGKHAGDGRAAVSLHVPPQDKESLSDNGAAGYVPPITRSQAMIPIPASASITRCNAIQTGRRRSLPLTPHSGRHQTQLTSSNRSQRETMTTEGSELEDATQSAEFPDEERKPMLRKVRLSVRAASKSRQVLSKTFTEKDLQQFDTYALELERTGETPKATDSALPRKFPWTKSFEILRKQAKGASTAAMQANTLTQPNNGQPLSYDQINSITNSLLKQEKRRRKGHPERTVQKPTNSTSIPYLKEDEKNTQEKKSRKNKDNDKTQPELIQDTDHSLHQVSQPQPSQYWLGRFVTLTNAFHYEDSFHQPDAVTGFGMLSSYSRPLGSAEGNLPDYRNKRAFMVLENACVTEEASRSLREFQYEYTAIHGNRWMV